MRLSSESRYEAVPMREARYPFEAFPPRIRLLGSQGAVGFKNGLV